MKIIITAATTGEWMPTFLDINTLYTQKSKRMKVSFHQCGVGMLATAVSLMRLITDEKHDLIIQAGIAGTFNNKTPLATTVVIKEETIADLGVEEDGKWKDIFDLKLEKTNYHPFEKKKLPNQWIKKFNLLKLPEVNAITINEISTNNKRIEQFKKKYNPVIESMEGAALHFVCREMNVPFIQIRSISNYVGERDKNKWQLKESIENLNKTLLLLIDKLYKLK